MWVRKISNLGCVHMGFWNLGSWSIVGLVLGFLGLLLGEGERGKKKEKERKNAAGERRKEKEERERESRW